MALTAAEPADDDLRRTPLDSLHRRLGARMIAFAGYLLPVQYPAGMLAEHHQTRRDATLFDISHMGQISVTAAPTALAGANPARALEALTPADIAGLPEGRQRYALLLNEAGGIIDDIMVASHRERLVVVCNGARRAVVLAHLTAHLPDSIQLTLHEDRALLALQGPHAAAALGRLAPEATALPFMGVAELGLAGVPCWIARCGYTGEDGFEISIPAGDAAFIAEQLLTDRGVAPAGLGARDSLRLEAGLCLYGQDIDELTSPVEAGLAWTIGRRRRADWDFPGAAVIRDQLKHGAPRQRVGIRPEGRTPARAQTDIAAVDGTAAGIVTSGGISPTLGTPVAYPPIAMGYVRRDLATPGTLLHLMVRGRLLPAAVTTLPFVPHRYVR